jgi:hypothetical protein
LKTQTKAFFSSVHGEPSSFSFILCCSRVSELPLNKYVDMHVLSTRAN